MKPDTAHEPSPIRGISRNVFILGLVSLATDASTEMVYPLIPLFLTTTLGAPASVLGLIEGLAEATASILKGFSGWLSDRIGLRKPLVVGGYGLAAFTKPLLALAAGWPMVLTARVLDRFGKGVRGTPRDAMIADSSEESVRGRAFGFHRSTDQMGAVIGPLAALPLLAFFDQNYRAVFVAAFVPAALGVLLLFFVKETGAGRGAAPPPSFRIAAAGPEYRSFLLVMLLFTLGNSSDVFLILRARQLGLTPTDIVLLFAAFNATYVASAYPAGILSDRIGRRRVIVAGLAVFAVVYVGFGFAPDSRWVWPLFLLYGLYHGLTDGTSRAYIAGITPPDQRGTALGTYAMTIGIGTFPASAAAGLLWDHAGPPAPFFVGAACAAISAVALSWKGAGLRKHRA
ncbi:MAG TPA: MFS transporter [Bryobacteraceae bacterium]|nr:MFS transporter [Bryobacteraceae bacterium]